jgi:2,4'-dihydroxyacetophenone dioxygenase
LLRLRSGPTVARHRHRGEVHAMNLSGHRRIDGRTELIGPGTYVYEPAGNIDSWQAVGEEDCVVSITVAGAMEYLDDEGNVLSFDDTDSLRATYYRWCAQTGTSPDPLLEIKPHRVES